LFVQDIEAAETWDTDGSQPGSRRRDENKEITRKDKLLVTEAGQDTEEDEEGEEGEDNEGEGEEENRRNNRDEWDNVLVDTAHQNNEHFEEELKQEENRNTVSKAYVDKTKNKNVFVAEDEEFKLEKVVERQDVEEQETSDNEMNERGAGNRSIECTPERYNRELEEEDKKSTRSSEHSRQSKSKNLPKRNVFQEAEEEEESSDDGQLSNQSPAASPALKPTQRRVYRKWKDAEEGESGDDVTVVAKEMSTDIPVNRLSAAPPGGDDRRKGLTLFMDS